jgi:tRNA 2-thiocytidine biosynthesis protein TtcA
MHPRPAALEDRVQQAAEAPAPPGGQAIVDYDMIRDGERVMVCLSGGKDSYAMLDVLRRCSAVRRCASSSSPCTWTRSSRATRRRFCRITSRLGIEYHILEKDTYSVVKVRDSRGQDHLRSVLAPAARHAVRFRRGDRRDAHRPGAPPRRHRRDPVSQHVFRRQPQGHAAEAAVGRRQKRGDPAPGLLPESDLARYAAGREFPIIPCNLCGSQDNLQRVAIKKMLRTGSAVSRAHETIFRAIGNVAPSQLADRDLFDFAAWSAMRGR